MKKLAVFLSLLLTFVLFVPYMDFTAQAAGTVYIKSETAVLMDAKTGTVLYDKNMNRQMHPASITKIMTGMLALEIADEKELMTTSHNAVYSLPYNTSHIALGEGELITLEQGMYALGIESANDAANVIAEHISGTTESFAQLMTQKAHSLGAVNTNFTNPHGLPDDNHYTTAYDMALITRQAIQTEDFNKYFSTNRYDMAPTNIRDVMRQFWNANYFINGYEECKGLVMSKTGWTEEAKHTMVTVAQRNGVTLIAVVMASTHKGDKFDDTTALFDYGFENFAPTVISADYVKENMPLALVATDGSSVTVNRTNYLTESIDVMLPKSKTQADVSFKTGSVHFNEARDFATVDVDVYYNDNGTSRLCGSSTVSLVFAAEEADEGPALADVMQKIVLIILVIILWLVIALLAFVALKQLVILENRRRIRKKRAAQLEAKRRKQQADKTVYRK